MLNTPCATRVVALPFGMEAEILWVNRAHCRRVPPASCVVMIVESVLASYQASSGLATPVKRGEEERFRGCLMRVLLNLMWVVRTRGGGETRVRMTPDRSCNHGEE